MQRNHICGALALCLITLPLVGCTESETESLVDTLVIDSLTEDETDGTEEEPSQILFVTGHGETDIAYFQDVLAVIEELGFVVCSGEISSDLSEYAVIFLVNPRADLSSVEYNTILGFCDEGGDVILLMESDESDTRYRYIEYLLDSFCLTLDYDILSESDSERCLGTDTEILLDIADYPSDMVLYSTAATEGTPYVSSARSVRMVYRDNYGSISVNVYLATATSAIGTPCGGIDEDPETYTSQLLDVMVSAQDESRLNATLLFIGAEDFLLDGVYDTTYTETTLSLLYSVLTWI